MGYSLGFWVDYNSTPQPTEKGKLKKDSVELHINYWSLEAKKSYHYLDIGVKFSPHMSNYEPTNEIQAINFYFPFVLTQDDYMGNLGEIVCQSEGLIELIFNENLIATKENKNSKELSFGHQSEEVLRFYTNLDLTNDDKSVKLIPSVSSDPGTTLSFSSKCFFQKSSSTSANSSKNFFKKRSSNQTTKISEYFRFRIRLSSENVQKFSQNYKAQDRFIVSKVEKIEIIDFRLNELRDLPGYICSKLNDNCNLETIHFFLIRDINDEFRLAHADYKRCRLLEKELWNNYMVFHKKKLDLPNQMIIYHFKEEDIRRIDGNLKVKNHISRFNAFAKFVRVKVSEITIILFLAFLLLSGAMASLLASSLQASGLMGFYKIFTLSDSVSYGFLSCVFLLLAITVFPYIISNWTLQLPFRRK